MLVEAGQVITEAARQGGSITIAIPTAFLSSIVTLLGREAISAFLSKKRRNGNNGHGGPKPGEAEVCRIRGERMAKVETETVNLKDDILRMERKIDRLLERK